MSKQHSLTKYPSQTKYQGALVILPSAPPWSQRYAALKQLTDSGHVGSELSRPLDCHLSLTFYP